MKPEEIKDLFDYLRSIYGGQFKQSDSDGRAWWKHLQPYSIGLVRQAVDAYIDQSNDDWPPNMAALKRLCKSIKRDQYQPIEQNQPKLEHSPDWNQWAEAQAQRLLFTYEWEPQPNVNFEELSQKAASMGLRGYDAIRYQLDQHEEAVRQTEEYTALVQLIRDRIPAQFEGVSMPKELTKPDLEYGAKMIFAAIGATKRKQVQLYQKIDAMA